MREDSVEKPDDCQRVLIYNGDVFLGERGKYAPTGDEPGELDGSIFDRMLEGYDEGVLIEAEGRGEIVKIYLWGDGTLVGDQVAEVAARAPVDDALRTAVEKAVAPAQIEWPPETT